MSFEVKQIVTQIIAFLIMLWVLKKYAWKPLLDLMDERTRKIEADFEEAEQKNREADLCLADYQEKIGHIKEEGQTIIQNSVKEARQIALEIQSDSQRKAHDLLNKAQEEADREVSKARLKLKKEMVDLSFSTFEKLLNMKLSKEEKERYNQKLMDEV